MTEPILCEGRLVRLRPVQADDLPAIVRLRNAARDSFLDSREVTVDGLAAWLGSMRFPAEGLLRIESPAGVFLGVTGWNHLCMDRREAEIGRLMIDRAAVLKEVSRSRSSVPVDAVRTLGRYLFVEQGLERIHTSYIVTNRYAAKVNRRCGMVPLRTAEYVRADGSTVEVVHLELTIQRWISLQDSYAKD